MRSNASRASRSGDLEEVRSDFGRKRRIGRGSLAEQAFHEVDRDLTAQQHQVLTTPAR
jgi:hypothetical protein